MRIDYDEYSCKRNESQMMVDFTHNQPAG